MLDFLVLWVLGLRSLFDYQALYCRCDFCPALVILVIVYIPVSAIFWGLRVFRILSSVKSKLVSRIWG